MKRAFLSGVTLSVAFFFGLIPAATAQTSGRASFSVSGAERYYCPPQAPLKTQGPLSICTGRISDAGTVTITINATPPWSTNASYSQGCTNLCVAQALANNINATNSGAPVTATYSNGVVTITAKAQGTQSNYPVSSSASTALPQYFSSASFAINPASFSLSGGTDIPPVAPTGLSATPAANGLSVALSWTDNSNIELNYRVERCTGSGCSSFGVLTSTLPKNSTSYIDPTALPSTTYRYRVQATNTAGGSPYATTSDVTTPSVPVAPTNFNAVPSADGRSVTVTWTDNATTETGYSGNYCPGGTPAGCITWQNAGTYPANTTSYTLSGLAPGSINKLEVHAYNAVGDSTHVGNVDITQPNYPNVPSITSAISGPGGTTATITWSDVATETAYYLERCDGAGCPTTFTVVGNNLPANTTSFADSGLASGTTYGYRMRAYSAVGYSAYSTIAYLASSSAPPAPPSGLNATSASNGQSVTLNWTDNASNETSYQLQRCTGTGCTPANYQSLAANATSNTDSPTTPSILYGYAVCAVNAGGSSCSSTVYVTASSGVATVHYYISDDLGSTSLVVNGTSGAVEEEEMYYPYGGERWRSGSDPNHYKFTGKERDAETGLDYFGARYYGNSIARWLNPDWSGSPQPVPYADLSDPQSLNLYSYVRNIPLNRADADGHDWKDLLKFAAGVSNAYGSDNLMGAGRVEQTTTAGRLGAAVGDTLAGIQGTLETAGGAGVEVVGIGLDATGVGSVLGVPANVAGAGMMLHGSSTGIIAGANLLKATKDGGSRTEPTLPNKTIAKEDGVEIKHFTRSGDHGPAHLHVEGGGDSTKIGMNGKPIKGSPELSATQQSVVDKYKAQVRSAVDKIQRWFNFNNK